MKKVLPILFALMLFTSCKKDENITIDAPALPLRTLSWGMSADNFKSDMQDEGYLPIAVSDKTYYIHYNNVDSFWLPEYDRGLTSLTCYYCGGNQKLARSFWAGILGLEDKFSKGLIGWPTICRTPIQTSNTTITLDEAQFVSVIVGGIKYTSNLTATYKRK